MKAARFAVVHDLMSAIVARSTQCSQSDIEGQVNRLKTLKRQMYGRAGVELLRARLIPLPTER